MHAQLPQMFDANTVAPSTGAAGILPVGEHVVIITGSEIKATAAGDGGRLVFDLKITEGPEAGATGKYGLNLFHPSEQASQIAKRELSALCHVTGRFQIQDASALANVPFRVVVQKQKDNDKYTEVVAVKDVNGNPPGKGGGQAQQPQGGPPQGQPPMQQAPQQNQQQAPQGGGWGGPPQGAQQAPAQQQQQGGWGGPPAQQGQPQQGQQAPAQQWSQGNAGSAPWGGGQ